MKSYCLVKFSEFTQNPMKSYCLVKFSEFTQNPMKSYSEHETYFIVVGGDTRGSKSRLYQNMDPITQRQAWALNPIKPTPEGFASHKDLLFFPHDTGWVC